MECKSPSLKKKTEVTGTRIKITSSGYIRVVGTQGLQEKAGTAKEKLDGHHQTKSKKIWTLPGMKLKNWQQTEQNGFNVWPNQT